MRHVWLVTILLINGCAAYPVNPDGTAWNTNGINYSVPNVASFYGSGGYGSYLSYPGFWWPAGSAFYPGYSSYSSLGYPCGSYWGCRTFVPYAPAVGIQNIVPLSGAKYVGRLHNIARPGVGVSIRIGGRHRGRR